MNEIERWDEWFAATEDRESIRAWNAAKSMFPDQPDKLNGWARLIELDRLDIVLGEKEDPGATTRVSGRG
jgi:hypothetical protein